MKKALLAPGYLLVLPLVGLAVAIYDAYVLYNGQQLWCPPPINGCNEVAHSPYARILTAGGGWAHREGGPIEEIRPGDVVWFSPGEKHWHGATPTTAMTHIAIQERLDGKAVEWLEKVTDEQYRR
jgi:hypothetical protein